MQNTKEKILLTALELFASRGYEAVSVSDIAGALGMTKGALYRHFESKQAIFEAILRRMEQRDTELAEEDNVPLEGEKSQASLDDIISFSKSMLSYWTEDPFARAFRQMLTIEQYRCAELNALYHQYLGSGPVEYVSMLLSALGYAEAEQMARSLYGVMHLCFTLCDASAQPERERETAAELLDAMGRIWKNG